MHFLTAKQSVESISVFWERPVSAADPNFDTVPIKVELILRPGSPDEFEWMQGVLLALSDGSLGEPCPSGGPGARPPRLRGPLARCTRLYVEWWGPLDQGAGEELALLPMFYSGKWRVEDGRPYCMYNWYASSGHLGVLL